MIVTSAEAYLEDIEVAHPRVDAIQQVTKQETIFVVLTTDSGLQGIGYSYTIGTGGRAVIALLEEHLLKLVVGQDLDRHEATWQRLAGALRFMSIGVIVNLALAAVDTALWDLRSKQAATPLWRLLGGNSERVPIYDTDGGWLHLSESELVNNARARRDAGWRAIKLKVGKSSAVEDMRRLSAVREAVGTDLDIMVDANQCFSRDEAMRRARMWEPLDIAWFEEPMPADDVSGHADLARSTGIPIAVGESLYSIGQFRSYLETGAASIMQPDVARVGGISPWMKIAHLCEAFNVGVAPHYVMELSVSLVSAVSNGLYVEHVPELEAVTTSRIEIELPHAIPPAHPGLGIQWKVTVLAGT